MTPPPHVGEISFGGGKEGLRVPNFKSWAVMVTNHRASAAGTFFGWVVGVFVHIVQSSVLGYLSFAAFWLLPPSLPVLVLWASDDLDPRPPPARSHLAVLCLVAFFTLVCSTLPPPYYPSTPPTPLRCPAK